MLYYKYLEQVQQSEDRCSRPSDRSRCKQYRDTELEARNLQLTHTIANILVATELSPRNERQSSFSFFSSGQGRSP